MPNHITNILEFECTPERVKVIAESLKSNPDEPLGQVDPGSEGPVLFQLRA